MRNEIRNILDALSEESLATRINEPHDDARARFRLESNSVSDYAEYERIIGGYYNYHFGAAVSPGAKLDDYDARERAKELIANAYRREGKDAALAYNNALKRRDGGMRRVLDTLADGLRYEHTERYMNSVFDRYVSPHDYEEKVEIIRQFLDYCNPLVREGVDASRPERYANDYKALIRAYLNAARNIGDRFRAL